MDDHLGTSPTLTISPLLKQKSHGHKIRSYISTYYWACNLSWDHNPQYALMANNTEQKNSKKNLIG